MLRSGRAARIALGGWLTLATAVTAGCSASQKLKSQTWTLSGKDRLSTAEGRVSVHIDALEHHVVELTFRHLAPARQAFVGTSYYMIWLVPRGGAAQAVGIITLNDARGASLTIRTAYEEFDVVVTAESFGNPSRPSRNLAFSTRIPGTV